MVAAARARTGKRERYFLFLSPRTLRFFLSSFAKTRNAQEARLAVAARGKTEPRTRRGEKRCRPRALSRKKKNVEKKNASLFHPPDNLVPFPPRKKKHFLPAAKPAKAKKDHGKGGEAALAGGEAGKAPKVRSGVLFFSYIEFFLNSFLLIFLLNQPLFFYSFPPSLSFSVSIFHQNKKQVHKVKPGKADEAGEGTRATEREREREREKERRRGDFHKFVSKKK